MVPMFAENGRNHIKIFKKKSRFCYETALPNNEVILTFSSGCKFILFCPDFDFFSYRS
jgi:hypothetical protein